ncbi:ABC transporter ATP-binding protein [Desertimonas flava]|uniref:ABC transporter ATP-binding protein n=1 Tax=Desertimonas flava TaxID=2064846 RepID=UPI000E3482D2|nr:ABC transporter ATP-binding protein [Desertimonas flava]
MTVVLQVAGLDAGYGQVPVLRDISLKVDEGEFVALLGANGVGKSTLLKSIAGLLRPSAGTITLEGRDITAERTETTARLGVGLVPEGRQLFGPMSVLDNLLLGAHTARRRRQDVAARLDHVLTLFPRLAERRRQRADSMSGGEQQMLAIGRCLMAEPRVVLLDEPSLGLAPLVVENLFHTVATLRATSGTTFVVVEQNVSMTLRHADRAYVLDRGRVALSGTADEIAASPAIREAYLGVTAGGIAP